MLIEVTASVSSFSSISSFPVVFFGSFVRIFILLLLKLVEDTLHCPVVVLGVEQSHHFAVMIYGHLYYFPLGVSFDDASIDPIVRSCIG